MSCRGDSVCAAGAVSVTGASAACTAGARAFCSKFCVFSGVLLLHPARNAAQSIVAAVKEVFIGSLLALPRGKDRTSCDSAGSDQGDAFDPGLTLVTTRLKYYGCLLLTNNYQFD
jgi:hypothetical protein